MESNQSPARPVPAPEGHLAIVFTDIVKSTDIWESNTNAMISAMKLHDDTVRNLTVRNSGYEVKQNGDGFMIAFPTAQSAIQFCLDVQESLLDEEWPSALLALDPGKETTSAEGKVLFKGLKLRMSAHWGKPVTNWNDVIQRMDYLGPVVNRAARFVQVTEAGQIVVSEDFAKRLQEEMEDASQPQTSNANAGEGPSGNDEDGSLPDLSTLRAKRNQETLTNQRFKVEELGEYEFQGLDDPQKLYFIVPSSLEKRVEHWHQVTHVSGVKGNVKT
jgi:adenylate cyclase